MSKTKDVFEFLAKQVKGYSKDRSNSRRFRDYYMSSKEDTRGTAAKIMDFAISRIIVFFTAYLASFFRLQNMPYSIIVALLVVSTYHIISIMMRDKRLVKMKKHKRRAIACQKILQEIMNYTVDELKSYMEKVFSKADFCNFNIRLSGPKLIIYDAIYNGQKILISTYINKVDYFVELKELKEFISQMKELEIRNGILITTSDFTKDCYQYIEEQVDQYKILLLNKDLMFKLIEKNEMFPSEEEIDELVENKISRRELRWQKYKTSILANKKTKSYFILTLFLFATGPYTPYPVYYKTVAGITFGLTIITLTMGLIGMKKEEENSWESLNKMMRDL